MRASRRKESLLQTCYAGCRLLLKARPGATGQGVGMELRGCLHCITPSAIRWNLTKIRFMKSPTMGSDAIIQRSD